MHCCFPLRQIFHSFSLPFFVQNKYLYMLPHLIWSVIIATIICIAFIVVTVASVLGLGMIDAIYQHAISESSTEIGSGIMQANVHSTDFGDALPAGKPLAGGLIFLFWSIFAIITGLFEHFLKIFLKKLLGSDVCQFTNFFTFSAIFWYFTVVLISLYKQMKAASFEQQPLPLT